MVWSKNGHSIFDRGVDHRGHCSDLCFTKLAACDRSCAHQKHFGNFRRRKRIGSLEKELDEYKAKVAELQKPKL